MSFENKKRPGQFLGRVETIKPKRPQAAVVAVLRRRFTK
jgi:hypothetical protein